MDKNEYRAKLDVINDLVDKQDYKGALEVVDTIDWRRVRSARTLCMVGEIYEANKRYEDSRKLLVLAHQRAPIGKTVLYRLVELSIKMGEFDEAVDYYEQFVDISPNDNSRYILKYKIYRGRRSPIQEQIAILEEYKSREYTERWAYELARLYAKAGMKDKCIEECDDLILWFSEGKYVTKAMELKMKYAPLSPSQEEKYRKRYIEPTPERTAAAAAATITAATQAASKLVSQTGNILANGVEEAITDELPPIESVRSRATGKAPEETSVFTPILETTEALQDRIAKSIRDVFSGGVRSEKTEEEPEDSQEEYTETEDTRDYVVKDLEPENLNSTKTIKPDMIGSAVASEVKAEVPERQKEAVFSAKSSVTSDIAVSPDGEVDLEALLAETADVMAQEVVQNIEKTEPEAAEANETETEEEIYETEAEEAEGQEEGYEAESEEAEAEEEVYEVESEEAEAEEEVYEAESEEVEAEEEVYKAESEEAEVEEEVYKAETEAAEAEEEVYEAESEEAEEEVYEVESEEAEAGEEIYEAESEEVEAEEEVYEADNEEAEVEEEVYEAETEVAEAEEVYEAEIEAAEAEEEVYEVESEEAEAEEEIYEPETPEEMNGIYAEEPEDAEPDDAEYVEGPFEEPSDESGPYSEELADNSSEPYTFEGEDDEVALLRKAVQGEIQEDAAEGMDVDIAGQAAVTLESGVLEGRAVEIPSAEENPDFGGMTIDLQRAIAEALSASEMAAATGEPVLDDILFEEPEEFDAESNNSLYEPILETPVAENTEAEIPEILIPAEEETAEPVVKTPETKVPEVKAPAVKTSVVKAPAAKTPEVKTPAAKPPVKKASVPTKKPSAPQKKTTPAAPKAAPAKAVQETQVMPDIKKQQKQPSSSPIGIAMEEILRHHLTKEEHKRLFTYFAPIPGLSEQIAEALDVIQESARQKTSRSGNIVITGREGSGKTRLSEGLIKAICKERRMNGAKIAYLNADKMNQKDPAYVVSKLAGGFLVVENAASLKEEVIEKLSKAMEFKTNRLTVILEDLKPGIQALEEDYPEFMEKFDSRIVIPVFTNDELVSFAKTYSKEMGYKIDDMAVLALYTLIGDNQNDDDPVTVAQVKEMMDEAIKHASRGGRRPGRKVAKRHLDDSGRIMLYEKDFDV